MTSRRRAAAISGSTIMDGREAPFALRDLFGLAVKQLNIDC